eukprot:SAG25_NODE_361_length_9156_cov_9.406647_3_plen_111_part_00
MYIMSARITGAFAFGDSAMHMGRSLVPTTTSTTQRQSLKNDPIEGVGHQEVAAHSGNGLQNCVTVPTYVVQVVGMPLTQGCAGSEQHTALMMVVAELNSAPLVQKVGAKN